MVNVVVSIGNSDNKLSQQKWASFVDDVDKIMLRLETRRHFFGGSHAWASWQNVCWLCEIDPDSLYILRVSLRERCQVYNQDAAFLLVGAGEFI